MKPAVGASNKPLRRVANRGFVLCRYSCFSRASKPGQLSPTPSLCHVRAACQGWGWPAALAFGFNCGFQSIGWVVILDPKFLAKSLRKPKINRIKVLRMRDVNRLSHSRRNPHLNQSSKTFLVIYPCKKQIAGFDSQISIARRSMSSRSFAGSSASVCGSSVGCPKIIPAFAKFSMTAILALFFVPATVVARDEKRAGVIVLSENSLGQEFQNTRILKRDSALLVPNNRNPPARLGYSSSEINFERSMRA